MKYIAKPNTWFDEGTEAFPASGCWEAYNELGLINIVRAAVFSGIKNGNPDEEICSEDEFDIQEEQVRFIDVFEIKE